MALRTPDEFRNSLKDGRVVYYKGERVEDVTVHPVLKIGVDSSAVDYELAENPETRELAVVEEPLRGVHRLLRGVQILLRGLNIGLGFAPVLAHGRTGQALIGGLGLFVLVFALLGSRG